MYTPILKISHLIRHFQLITYEQQNLLRTIIMFNKVANVQAKKLNHVEIIAN